MFLSRVVNVLKSLQCTRWKELPTRPRNKLARIWAKIAYIDVKTAADMAVTLRSLGCEPRMLPIELRSALFLDSANEKVKGNRFPVI